MFEVKLTITAEQVDPEYNHVHHAQLLVLMEQARLRYLSSIGFPREAYMQQGLFWVIAALSASYKREVRAGEITITCENLRIEGKKLLIEQCIYNERGKLAVLATIESMLLDPATKRSATIPEEFCAAVLRSTK